jgi:protein-disulfide isomerase
MNSRYPRRGGPWRILLALAALWLVTSAAAAAAQTAANTETVRPAGTRAQSQVRALKVAARETYQGTPVGFTVDGYPFRGNPDAPLALVEYTDYLCPFCERYFQQTLPALMEKYGRTGQVRFVVHDFPLASLHPTAPRGAAAARCVGEQGATRFWQMHEALFQAQQEWNRLADPTAFLAKVAQKIGAEMRAYENCMASGRNDPPVQQSVAAGQALGFTGTPTFQFVHQPSGKTYTLVGAQPVDVFTRWIDTVLAGKEPPQAKPPEKPELPLWAKPEGLAPDPKRPGFTVAGDPYKGNPNAKLVLVEFGDFQCPACQRHALTTQPVLDKRFVETGEVLWVAKHFPLRVHPQAPVAAAAAECAGDQGKFWAMHDRLFEQVEQWSKGDDPDAALVRLAADLQLDRAPFTACLMSRKALERVLSDLYDGQGVGVKNIPMFLLIHGGTARVLVGARSAEEFAATLQEQLERAKSAGAGEPPGPGVGTGARRGAAGATEGPTGVAAGGGKGGDLR